MKRKDDKDYSNERKDYKKTPEPVLLLRCIRINSFIVQQDKGEKRGGKEHGKLAVSC